MLANFEINFELYHDFGKSHKGYWEFKLKVAECKLSIATDK